MQWTEENFRSYCNKYKQVDYIFDYQLGCISWHLSTGGILEIIELEAAIPGLGQGYVLYRQMVEKILETGQMIPRHGVIGYRRTHNKEAEYFYKKMGWQQVNLGHSIYAEGEATLLWTTWEQLRKRVNL